MAKKSVSSSKKSKHLQFFPNLSRVNVSQAKVTLEGMYTLHLLLLLVMTSLAAFLLVLVVRQENQIRSLEFRLDFMYDKYGYEKARNDVVPVNPESSSGLVEKVEAKTPEKLAPKAGAKE